MHLWRFITFRVSSENAWYFCKLFWGFAALMASKNAGRPGLLLLSLLRSCVEHHLALVIGSETGCLLIEFAQDHDSLILGFLWGLGLLLVLFTPTIRNSHLKNIVILLGLRIVASCVVGHTRTREFDLQPLLLQGYLVVLTLDATEVFLHPVLEAVDSIDSPHIGIINLEQLRNLSITKIFLY